ncbi:MULTISPECIES: LTA synthase family protein [unclassified Streptococcus]|uniref:LTA synthase family protein n=1 Tax=unclassified Streptococcus TaxID=2608887 RepID=UPI001071883F|nr:MULTISPECIES: alkaline phosphatase family protein [unclassified Streptococcus]MBF0806395.1 sulfatase-like hydrolase/transferase [Streptococcus sp. 19428wA2_WM07]TFU27983.1 alkaline phosphatase family protein [Streptococcus sp. WM07]
MNYILEFLSQRWLEWKHLAIAKSQLLTEDITSMIEGFSSEIEETIQSYIREKYEQVKKAIQEEDWSARAFEGVYILLMIGLSLVLVTNYHLGEYPAFLGLTTGTIMWFYLFLSLFAGLMTLPYVSGKTIIPILLGYVIYFPLLFLLEWSRQLNNPDFKLEQLFEIHPLTQVHFYTLLIILTIASALRLAQREFYIFQRFEGTGLYRARRSVWTMASMAPLMVMNPLFLEFVNGTISKIAETNQLSTYTGFIMGQIVLWFTIGFVLFASFYNSLREIGLHHFGRANAIFSSFVFAVVFNLLFQSGLIQQGDVVGRFILPRATLFQVIVIFSVSLLVYVLLNRYLYASLLIMTIGLIFTIVNSIKFSYRQEPILPTDFIWIREPELFVSFVDIGLFFTAVIVMILLLYVAWNIQIIMPSKQIFSTWPMRVVLLFTFLGMAQLTVDTFRSEENGKIPPNVPVISVLHNWVDVTWKGLSINASYKSLAYVWTRQLTQIVMAEPENYSREQIELLVEKYRQKAVEINQARTKSLKSQTVIFVLSESFSDPKRIASNQLTQNPIPEIEQIMSETSSGLMHSDGYGGGTANMEFQTLTGLPFYNYSRSTSNIYVEVVPNMTYLPSITRSFKGSDSFVIHPSGANNYNRINIYKDLGFENLYFTSESLQKITDRALEGVNVSDRSVYNEVLAKIQPDRSQFFSVITMQNHVPWSAGQPADMVATNPLLNEQQNGDLTSYTRLLNHTDKATKDFLEQLTTISKDITVVFYGDHLPGFYPLSVFKDQPHLQFETDYFIWSNTNHFKEDYPLINSSDFGAALLEKTDSKVSPYYALLESVLKERRLNAEGQFEKDREAEKDLELIQYDITSGKGYSAQNQIFFELP